MNIKTISAVEKPATLFCFISICAWQLLKGILGIQSPLAWTDFKRHILNKEELPKEADSVRKPCHKREGTNFRFLRKGMRFLLTTFFIFHSRRVYDIW